ncbi:serine arginine-rich splicing factor-like [Raphidocelis subcapitata]|uniref:Serine arginine-rich splicing factor-like n=1 Tax=Raphidocelis subcapitata TaxID=307507 RepID=A0A2V0PDH9_9CHLO|nr:serine arginine-rich splicing factor-like [Raphidocelis subcapitata]|eukprot:GBF97896.1 serine arginine-rich splicing factor-like [Raphidocelis subcapitata]
MAVEGKNVVFCGNFEYDASERDINRLFERYGPVERIDMKTGFAFVYMKNKKDGDEAIYDLDRREWGYRRPRPLKVQWAKVGSARRLGCGRGLRARQTPAL